MKQYLSVSEAATELGTSEAHIRNLVRGIRSATPERYHDSDIIGAWEDSRPVCDTRGFC